MYMKVEGVEVLNLNSNYEGFNPEDIFHELKKFKSNLRKVLYVKLCRLFAFASKN